MNDRDHAQVRLDINVVRALLDGVLATPCHFVRSVSYIASGEPIRQCVAHLASDPCPVAALREARKDYDDESDAIVQAQKEAWLESPEVDEEEYR